jgi:hypothetical protein
MKGPEERLPDQQTFNGEDGTPRRDVRAKTCQFYLDITEKRASRCSLHRMPPA